VLFTRRALPIVEHHGRSSRGSILVVLLTVYTHRYFMNRIPRPARSCVRRDQEGALHDES